jgi:hypothetical protein
VVKVAVGVEVETGEQLVAPGKEKVPAAHGIHSSPEEEE